MMFTLLHKIIKCFPVRRHIYIKKKQKNKEDYLVAVKGGGLQNS